MKPNLFIIGVQKAGTTALAHFLNQHPDICVGNGKEAHVFDDPNYLESVDKDSFAAEKYNRFFSNWHGEKIKCDATPITLFIPEILESCYQYSPNAKFIVSLRNQVDRAVSHYYMSKGREIEKLSMLSAFINESKRIGDKFDKISWPNNSAYRNFSYLKRGLYLVQLAHLYKTIPSKQILVIDQRDLKNQHQKTLNEIFDFINVSKKKIKKEIVFAREIKSLNLDEELAKLYARAYFLLRGETSKKWKKLVKNN